MADTWLTIEQAAVTLGLSVRTINRHINAGKLQSRLHEGRREVLVSLPTGGTSDSAQSDDRETVTERTERAVRSERPDAWADRAEPAQPRGAPVNSASGGGATPFSGEQVSAQNGQEPDDSQAGSAGSIPVTRSNS